MGLSFSSLFTSLSSLVRWSKDQDVRILMLGLDAAGKVRCFSFSWSLAARLTIRCACTTDDHTLPSAGKTPPSELVRARLSILHHEIGEVVPTIPSELLSFS